LTKHEKIREKVNRDFRQPQSKEQEGGKGWTEELRTQGDRNKIGASLFSLSFY
jgi:hypothetical protein